MEKVLFLTAFAPSENAAAEKNTKIMLKDLSCSFDVDLLYFKYDRNGEYIPETPNINVVRIVRNTTAYKLTNILLYPWVHPYFSVRFNWSILRYIKRLMSQTKYKAVIIDHSEMFLYGKYIDKSVPKILLAHDVMAQRVARSSNALIAKICRISEGFAINQYNSVISTFNQKDVDLFEQLYNKKAILSLDYIDERIINYKSTYKNDDYVMFGNWRRADNYEGAIWFFDSVAPLIDWKIKIRIIGKGFPMDKLHVTNPNVEIINEGFVDNPYPEIAECKAEISPLFSGAGIKVKVIEALASGTPVIGTEMAFEGFPERYNIFMLKASSPEDFCKLLKQCNFSAEERLIFKKMFIQDFQSLTIPNYIKTYL